MPLNISAVASVCFTFLLLGALSWTSGVRIVQAAAVKVGNAEFVRQAKACGCRPSAILFRHVAPAIRPVVVAQFWLLTPILLLAEANLGMLGLGVTEPLPSWGNLLAELQTMPAITQSPWLFAPAVLLLSVLLSLQACLSKEPHS
jgi:ABC-type dipeptide/oligopeptide/nickel transport system permease subunit